MPPEIDTILNDDEADATVLLPPDDDLSALAGAVTTGQLLAQDVVEILALHVLPKSHTAAELVWLGDGAEVETADAGGTTLVLFVSGAGVTFVAGNSTATITDADVDGCAGESVIHKINGVLSLIDLSNVGNVGSADSALADRSIDSLPPSSSSSNGLSLRAIIIIVVAVAPVVLACAVACCVGLRRRRRGKGRGLPKRIEGDSTKDTDTTEAADPSGDPKGGQEVGNEALAFVAGADAHRTESARAESVATRSTTTLTATDARLSVAAESMPSTVPEAEAGGAFAVQDAGAPRCSLLDVPTLDSLGGYITKTVMPEKPGPNASLEAKKEYLDRQLDSLVRREVIGHLSVLGGHKNRLHGGQAVVQLVEDRRTRLEYAMKFFLSPSAFLQERALYTDPDSVLGQFLPQLHCVVEESSRQLVDGHGTPLPSCIVMEKGEALDLWAKSTGEGIDMVTGLQVLTHIAQRLKDLHEAGYTHRDIKPGNIMFLPRTKRWTLIDFGCAARIGEFAHTGFSLFYAAPEALQAYKSGKGGLIATEALDAWSLGIMAIEMFSGQPVFELLQSKDKITAMILGEQPAPWEAENTADRMLKRLGYLRKPVLTLLERDPVERPTMLEFHQACRRVLSHTTAT